MLVCASWVLSYPPWNLNPFVYLQKYDEQGVKSLLESHFCDAYKYYDERVIIVIELTWMRCLNHFFNGKNQ